MDGCDMFKVISLDDACSESEISTPTETIFKMSATSKDVSKREE